MIHVLEPILYFFRSHHQRVSQVQVWTCRSFFRSFDPRGGRAGKHDYKLTGLEVSNRNTLVGQAANLEEKDGETYFLTPFFFQPMTFCEEKSPLLRKKR